MGCTLPAGKFYFRAREIVMKSLGIRTVHLALGGITLASVGFGPTVLWSTSTGLLSVIGGLGAAMLVVAGYRVCNSPNTSLSNNEHAHWDRDIRNL